MKYKYNYTYRFHEDGAIYAFDFAHLLLAQLDEMFNACFDYLEDKTSYNELQRYGTEEEIQETLEAIDDLAKQGYYLTNQEQRYEYQSEFETGLISLPPIHRCNLRCAYCFAEQGDVFIGEQREFTREQVEKALRYIYYNYMPNCKKYRIDFVSGGEPLLNFDVIRYVREISNQLYEETKKPLEMWVCTNGTLLTEEKLKYLDENHINIGISIDGDEFHHNQIRKDYKGNGTYQTIVKSIQKIKESKELSNHIKDIWGLVVITSKTESLRDILLHHESIGFKNIQMKIVRLKKDSEYAITKENVNRVKAMYDELFELFNEDVKQQSIQHVKLILNDNDFAGKIVRRLLLRYVVLNRCQAGRSKVSVAANGDLYPCDSFVGQKEFCLGNIDGEVVTVNQFQTLTVDTNEHCSNCWAKYMCSGDCYQNSQLVNGSIYQPDEVICELEQHVIKKALLYVEHLMEEAPRQHKRIVELLEKREQLRK